MRNKLLTLLLVALGWHNQGFSQIAVTSTQTWNATNFNSTPPVFGSWSSINNTLTLTNSVVVDRGGNPNRVTLTISGITVEFADGTSLQVAAGEMLRVD